MPGAICKPEVAEEVFHITCAPKFAENLTTITYAIRGSATTTQGETLTNDTGAVIDMTLMKGMSFNTAVEIPYVDVYAGELWENVVSESLKLGFAPKSLPDYLEVTVGGTLSTGGIGGQTFRHGPVISSVLRLEVITGSRKFINCSEEEHPEIFHTILGGLGQFAVIIKARIALEKAPTRVKWARTLYPDFDMLQCDQEYLISKNDAFDYIEGFIHLKKYRKASYHLDVALYYNSEDEPLNVDERFAKIADQLNYRDGHIAIDDKSYEEFLNRHKKVTSPRWDSIHPWINLLVPKRSIKTFLEAVFGKTINYKPYGPILIYPVNRTKWNDETSLVAPDEEIFYLVSIQPTSARSERETQWHLSTHKQILKFCKDKKIGVKQYIPHYGTKEEWKDHFGDKKWMRL